MGNSIVIQMILRTIIELDIFNTIAKTKFTIAVDKTYRILHIYYRREIPIHFRLTIYATSSQLLVQKS